MDNQNHESPLKEPKVKYRLSRPFYRRLVRKMIHEKDLPALEQYLYQKGIIADQSALETFLNVEDSTDECGLVPISPRNMGFKNPVSLGEFYMEIPRIMPEARLCWMAHGYRFLTEKDQSLGGNIFVLGTTYVHCSQKKPRLYTLSEDKYGLLHMKALIFPAEISPDCRFLFRFPAAKHHTIK